MSTDNTSDDREYEVDFDDQLEDLTGEQLIALAMKAFLFVHKNKPEVSDEQLLMDILGWFEIMTFGLDLPDVADVEPALGGSDDGETKH